MHTSDRGGRDWDGRDTNSLAADAASVMSKASKEMKESKVAEEKSLKCSRSTSTLLRMISGVSETSCLGKEK